MEDKNSEIVQKALNCGLKLLESDIKIKTSDMEDLVNLKILFRNFLSGELIILDKKKFEELNSNKEEN